MTNIIKWLIQAAFPPKQSNADKAAKLIAAIHASCNGYPLKRSQKRMLRKFKKDNPVKDIPFDWEIIKHMQGAAERARQSWPAIEKRMREFIDKNSSPD